MAVICIHNLTKQGKRVGKDVDIPDNIGVIIETPGFLPNFPGYKNLAQLAKIKRKIGKNEIRAAMERVGLNPDDKKHVGKYSLGVLIIMNGNTSGGGHRGKKKSVRR